MPRLEMRTGRHAGKTFELSKAVILGRGDSVAIRVPDGKASREHCRVFQQGGKWVVVDLNSRNGITVNGVKTTRKELISGDQIAIGETIIAYVDEAAAGQPKAVEPVREPEPGEIVVDEIDLDAGAEPAAAARSRKPEKAAKDKSAKDAAYAAARADAARRAQRGSGSGRGGGGETGMKVSDKVLQFNRVDARSTNPLQMELSQYPVVIQILIVAAGLAVIAIGIWLLLKALA